MARLIISALRTKQVLDLPLEPTEMDKAWPATVDWLQANFELHEAFKIGQVFRIMCLTHIPNAMVDDFAKLEVRE